MSHELWLGVGQNLFRLGVEWSWPWGMVEHEGAQCSFCGCRTVCLFEGGIRSQYTLYYFGPLSIGWARRITA